ncbi:MAG TPA: DUF4340 domain-containing protein [Acidobacteriota bacterium]|nr:DUF4340 domain-containing protein [Acidobacteriota bacterium]
MRFRGTFFLLIACVVVIGALYFHEKLGERREKAKDAETRLWDIDTPESIVRINLFSGELRIIAERRPENRWLLTAPQQYDADTEELNRLAGDAANLRRESIVETDSADPGRFGLRPAGSGIKLTLDDGREYELEFGIVNPTGKFTYAAIGGTNDIFMIPVETAESFNRRVEDLRDRTILRFERQDIQSLRIMSPKGLIDLVKDRDSDWWFSGIEKRAASGPDVRTILNALSLEKITGFFNDTVDEYENHRLDRPLIEVTLLKNEDRTERLIIGNEKSLLRRKRPDSGQPVSGQDDDAGAAYLARSDSRPDLFFVGQSLIDKLLVSANDVRNESIAFFQRWNVDTIELKNSRGNFKFIKSGGEWFFGDEGVKADREAVYGILDALEKPVIDWIDEPAAAERYGLDRPSIHVILKQGDAVMVECSVGKKSENGIYVMIAGDGSVKLADPKIMEALDRDKSAFVEVSTEPSSAG